APIFMFTAGLVFTYLLKTDRYDFLKNPRITKGLKRAVSLILIGYLLRYPTYKIFDFSNISQNQWDIFFSVDALHLIGFGMLVVIFSVLVSKRAHISLNIVLISIISILLISSPFLTEIEWINIFPQYIASYFTTNYGSFFPIFPWLIYVLAGGLLGNYLYKNDGIYLKKRFSFSLSLIGGIFVALSIFFFSLQNMVEREFSYWFYSNGLIFLRVGYVILLNSVMSFIVRKLNSIPQIIKETGKKTLLLYVVHVVILYGSAWFPGFYKFYAKSYTPIETIMAVTLMITLMLAIVQFGDKFKLIKNGKVKLKKVLD
ncbi:MAG: DUF1624 domain-containing protein, partial [Melioribacteraceae bacterium]|nr:DUF1624 domain-containing protein [Melioribacteraceae bacterium]